MTQMYKQTVFDCENWKGYVKKEGINDLFQNNNKQIARLLLETSYSNISGISTIVTPGLIYKIYLYIACF